MTTAGADTLDGDDGDFENDAELEQVDDTDLTPFQVNCLYVIIGFEQGRYTRTRGSAGAYGLDIKRTLERPEWYDEEVNHSRLYQNLDGLVDDGLLEKEAFDKRTNIYQTTDAGRRLVAETLQRNIACFKGESPGEGGDD